jgi:S1-C subfamily serine protease
MKNTAGWKLLGIVLLVAGLLASCSQASPAKNAPVPTLENIPTPNLGNAASEQVLPSDELLVSIYKLINPGVVAILIYSGTDPVGQGSGFVIDNEGHIVTNYHVVENVSGFEVAFSDGYRAVGELVGIDPDSDIAVLKVSVPQNELVPLALGSSSEVRVGQTVIAIGNPYGLSGTMTAGIVSARGRLFDTMRSSTSAVNFSAADLIQTDAAINPGNSGGPLLNLKGEVIGINRALRTSEGVGVDTVSNTGIGFAVPIDIVKRVVPFLIRDGRYDYPYLGITSREEFTLPQLDALGLPPNLKGVYVVTVPKGTPAEKAGLLGGTQATAIEGLPSGGDLITSVNGHEVLNFSDFLSYLVTNTSPGDMVNLTVLREGKELQFKVTVVARPQ